MAAHILGGLPAEGYLFPARGNEANSYSGWSKSKAALDLASGVDDWTLHDLRRTFATNLAGLNVAPHVVEKLLNHASGTISGVAAIYNRFQYVAEMRAAVEGWEARLTSLLNQK
jgi:integrase